MEWQGSVERHLRLWEPGEGWGDLAVENLTVGPFQLKAKHLVSSGFSKIQDPETSMNSHTEVLGTGSESLEREMTIRKSLS